MFLFQFFRVIFLLLLNIQMIMKLPFLHISKRKMKDMGNTRAGGHKNVVIERK